MLQDEISPTIKPGDDFYRYVNQKWIDDNPIPANKSRVVAFSVLGDENTERLKSLLESPDNRDTPVNVDRIKAFYRSAMDVKAIESLGLGSLRPVLEVIRKLDSRQSLKAFIADWHGRGLSLVWHIGLDVDDKDSRRYVVRMNQAGLGLPDRDYYFEESERFVSVRDQYLEFLTNLFTLLGADKVNERAETVYRLERKLAEASDTAVQRRDVAAKYNPYTLEQLGRDFSGLDWSQYIEKTGFLTPQELLVSQPKFIAASLKLLNEEPLETWQSYFMAHTLIPLMPVLPKAFDELSFGFYGKVLSGALEQEPRYRRVINMCVSILPEPTGQLFVETYFDESAKVTIRDLVNHIQTAMRKRINSLVWMTDKTKKRALEKLDTFLPLLGYPDTWRDYSALQLEQSYLENFLAAIAFEWQRDTGRLMEPVDRTEWLQSPAVVNAYYWSNTNGITFPAGILQAPFFDAKGDLAANYGGIGMVIGHEITHGFDDKGSQFDKIGNLDSWWTDRDRTAFEARGKQLIEQYDGYEVNGRHVNGALTLGENIADLGGALIAYDAMQQKLLEVGERELVDGFTPEKRFFMSLARIWHGQTRPELTLRLLVSDPHSPSDLRVNAVVTNIDPFYEAFDVRPGDLLYKAPKERVRIW